MTTQSHRLILWMHRKKSGMKVWLSTRKCWKVRLDTGADCNVISMDNLRKLRLDKKVSKSHSKLVAYAGHQIQAKGKIMLTCQYKDKKHDVEFEVIKNKAPAILGGESCEEMGLVKRLHVLKTERVTFFVYMRIYYWIRLHTWSIPHLDRSICHSGCSCTQESARRPKRQNWNRAEKNGMLRCNKQTDRTYRLGK